MNGTQNTANFSLLAAGIFLGIPSQKAVKTITVASIITNAAITSVSGLTERLFSSAEPYIIPYRAPDRGVRKNIIARYAAMIPVRVLLTENAVMRRAGLSVISASMRQRFEFSQLRSFRLSVSRTADSHTVQNPL